MPPSTVFSYWRRERRRFSSAASPVSPSISQQQQQQQQQRHRSSSPSKGRRVTEDTTTTPPSPLSPPPQIPKIPTAPPLTTAVAESTGAVVLDVSSENEKDKNNQPPALDTGKLNGNTNNNDDAGTSTSSNVSLCSPINPVVPSSSSERPSRQYSSSEEQREQEQALTPESNHSRHSFTGRRQSHAEIESFKPSSPFRLSFPRAILRNQSHSDGNKRSSTANVASSPLTTSHFRLKASPEDTSRDKDKDKDRDKAATSTTAATSSSHQSRDGSAEHTTHHKSGKTMLHLLNPMSLLARRRSSHIAGSRAALTNVGYPSLVPAIPDDYDPRIRGNIVHDFSAPRPRRNVSSAAVLQRDTSNRFYNGYGSQAQDKGSGFVSNRNSQHLPAFKENFEDDQNTLQVENKGYLNSKLLTNPPHPDDEQSVPVFARNLPSRVPDNDGDGGDRQNQEQAVVIPEPVPEARAIDPTVEQQQGQEDCADYIAPQQPNGLPKHFKSNASRFSFDMNGVGSSVEEKLLEEKHKKKEEAARQAKKEQLGQRDDDGSDLDEDFDSDLLDDADGLEEKIPGVNVDDEGEDEEEDEEEDEFSGFSGPGNAIRNSFYASGVSPDINTFLNPIGSVINEDSPADHSYSSSVYSLHGPEYQGNDTMQQQQATGMKSSTKLPPGYEDMNLGAPQWTEDDDDLYFDDGEFGDLSADPDGEKFDESIFDDETSHLYDRSTPAARLAAARLKGDSAAVEELEAVQEEEQQQDGLKHAPSMASEFRTVPNNDNNHDQSSSSSEWIPNLGPPTAHAEGVLSEHNLEAFHNALAKAASEAATKNTRFERSMSVTELSMGQESPNGTTHTLDSHPGLMSDDSHLSQAADALGFEDIFEDVNYDDEDGAFYDDPIIAAANAEALENDDEGFYGQEFGFYAQAHASCSSELTNGGYFGPRGVEGVTRSHSGRGKFQEPSLTPITERSEWSTRNSVASLNAFGLAHPPPASPGPGLAQLVDMGSPIDDEMSLSALLKLRRGAWGGSEGSVSSGASSPPPVTQYPSSTNRSSFPGASSRTLSMMELAGGDYRSGLLSRCSSAGANYINANSTNDSSIDKNKNTDDEDEEEERSI